MGWTLSERLFLLFEDGRLSVFSLMGDRLSDLKLFEQAFTDIVMCGTPTESGCLCYTRTGRMYVLFFSPAIPNAQHPHSL